jgi:hypothetical protein
MLDNVHRRCDGQQIAGISAGAIDLQFALALELMEKTFVCNGHKTLTCASKHEILDIT